jgi:hypothetical protein
MDFKFKVNDRVRTKPYKVTVIKDANGILDGLESDLETTTYSERGCIGTVREIREEATLAAKESAAASAMYLVQWDNGTVSYHGPEGLITA